MAVFQLMQETYLRRSI